jgi:hypothetical protein
MTIFDLLFIGAVLTSAITLINVVVLTVRRQFPRAKEILGIWARCAAVYCAIALGESYLRPQRVLAVGDPWCFDDWCLTVENVDRTSVPPNFLYEVRLRISSRAGLVSQRAKGAWIYLIDNRGRLYPPGQDPADVPLDVLLPPMASVVTARKFQVPPSTTGLGLVTGHGGPYCGPVNLLVIGGGGCLFKKPTMIRVQ